MITIVRRKLLWRWEPMGFDMEEHINHVNETLLVAKNVRPDGCADVRKLNG